MSRKVQRDPGESQQIPRIPKQIEWLKRIIFKSTSTPVYSEDLVRDCVFYGAGNLKIVLSLSPPLLGWERLRTRMAPGFWVSSPDGPGTPPVGRTRGTFPPNEVRPVRTTVPLLSQSRDVDVGDQRRPDVTKRNKGEGRRRVEYKGTKGRPPLRVKRKGKDIISDDYPLTSKESDGPSLTPSEVRRSPW